jgi:hypothetical protein
MERLPKEALQRLIRGVDLTSIPTKNILSIEGLNEVVLDKKNTRSLRKIYARVTLALLAVQLVFADYTFLMYSSKGVKWKIPSPVLEYWLSAVVVEVVGIALVVTKWLFPKGVDSVSQSTSSDDPSEAEN